MRIGLAQLNTTVGDFAGNEAKILAAYEKASQAGADLVLVPELAVCGYPPRDLIYKTGFLENNWAVVERLRQATTKTGLLVGYAGRNEERPGREATNSAALLQNGQIVAIRTKTLLPTYDVFDEDRYFEPATENLPVIFNGRKIGITICEDVWNDEDFWRDRRYRCNPAADLLKAGATLLLNVSASPWHLGKNQTRRTMLGSLAGKAKVPLIYCNAVGGNDELVFDGASLVFNAAGQTVREGPMFAEELIVIDLEKTPESEEPQMPEEEQIFRALGMGLRDYVQKCGFKAVVLGLSGGIDSALTAVIAAEALGAENVRGISMPSQYSSQGSLDDAGALAEKLGIRYDVIPIQPMFEAAKAQLKEVFAGRKEDATEENIQARLRGMILMALSNKFGSLLLTTGNKSELAVGYCTLYGDMCGGLAVISDVPKTMIYRIAKWLNAKSGVIPEASITKAPSAELRPNQKDQDSLPPYDVLDAILEQYIVQYRSAAEIIKMGFNEETVRKVIRMIDGSEYKRRQAAPGLKVTSKAFGLGRRIPIAQRYAG
jgi:NAD+ synthase/NAD+ synthase (glutamine-hydrolysing)